MPSLSFQRTIAALACATALVALSVASNDVAMADTVAPPTTMSNSVQFTVPAANYHPDAPAYVIADMINPYGAVAPNQFSVKIGCDRGTVYPVTISPTSFNYPTAYGYAIRADLPSGERGHTCVISSTSPAGRQMVFSRAKYSAPELIPGVPDPRTPEVVHFSGTIITASRTGGL